MSEYKGYKVESRTTDCMKVIKSDGKGSVHMSLRGMYTSTAEAHKAIDFYEKTKAKPKASEGKNENAQVESAS